MTRAMTMAVKTLPKNKPPYMCIAYQGDSIRRWKNPGGPLKPRDPHKGLQNEEMQNDQKAVDNFQDRYDLSKEIHIMTRRGLLELMKTLSNGAW